MGLWEKYRPELVTDLYELTMAASYLEEGMSGDATFSLFIRDYPDWRSYFVSAGIDHLMELLADLRFDEGTLEYIASLGKFSPKFLEYLRAFRFSGTVRAIPEGRIFFTQEPIVEVTAPIIEAQIVETLVMNVVQLETMMASKAARMVHAARGNGLIDFGMRRSHGVDAAVKAARASYIVGFQGTSNLLAGKLYGIPVYGTMAHSYVTSFPCELDAYSAFARTFPDNAVLLIDTYDTLSGARKAIETARILEQKGKRLIAVRLDSGDMAELSRQVRLILDQAGLVDVQVMASGNLDEFKIESMVNSGAKIDTYAVGTRLCVSADAPYLDIAYKLVEYDGKPILKLSTGKKTWIGKKQVYRTYDDQGMMDHDRLCLAERAEHAGGEPLLHRVMEKGLPCHDPEPLEKIRTRFRDDWRRLPLAVREIRPRETLRVEVSDSLREMDESISRKKRVEEVDPWSSGVLN